MKVSFVQSGGFAGLNRGCELDTAELADDEAEELKRLVREAGIASLQRRAKPRAYADSRRYDITVDDGGRRLAATLSDSDATGTAGELLGFLRGRSKPIRPS